MAIWRASNKFVYSLKKSNLQRNTEMVYTGAPIVGIARWSVPRIGQGHLEVKW